MMRSFLRLAAAVCCLMLLLPPAPAPAEEEEEDLNLANHPLLLRPNERYPLDITLAGWVSDAPEVAVFENGAIRARDEGFATLILLDTQGTEHRWDVTVSEDALPALIQAAVDLALQEWETNLGKTFTDRNKYTRWYCGNAPGCHFGWCGGFVSYCLDTAGVPMDEENDCVPHEGGVPWAVRAAGVGKLLKGFTNMERVGMIPRAGYLVVYGKRDYYDTIHVGMVTEAKLLEDGTWLIRTVEGNVSSRIKRYCYIFDPEDTTEHNYHDAPEEYRTEPEIYQYTIHQNNWFIHRFLQTWQPQEETD